MNPDPGRTTRQNAPHPGDEHAARIRAILRGARQPQPVDDAGPVEKAGRAVVDPIDGEER